MPQCFSGRASHSVETCNCTACAAESRCVLVVLGCLLYVLMASLPDMTLVSLLLCLLRLLCRMLICCQLYRYDSCVADRVIRSSMYPGSRVNISFPGRLKSIMLSSFTCGSAAGSTPKNATHVIGLRTTPWLAFRFQWFL